MFSVNRSGTSRGKSRETDVNRFLNYYKIDRVRFCYIFRVYSVYFVIGRAERSVMNKTSICIVNRLDFYGMRRQHGFSEMQSPSSVGTIDSFGISPEPRLCVRRLSTHGIRRTLYFHKAQRLPCTIDGIGKKNLRLSHILFL